MKRVNVNSNNGGFYIMFSGKDDAIEIKVFDMETNIKLEPVELEEDEYEMFCDECRKFIQYYFS